MSDQLTIWTVYERPLDYPEGFVARMHVVLRDGRFGPTDTAFYGPTLDSVRRQLPGGLVAIARDPSDEPQIVECWI